MKLGIIGAGSVGEIVAYTSALRGIATDIILNDVIKEKAISQAIDLNDGRPFYPKDVKFRAGEYEDMKDRDVVVVCSGKIPEKDRLQELDGNKKEVANFTKRIVNAGFKGIFVVVTNPVDIITYEIYKVSGFDEKRVIGSGTALDSARLEVVIANKLGISPKSVNATVLGEHGESQFVPWSQVKIDSLTIDKYEEIHPELFKNFNRDEIEDETRNRGWDIFTGKGSTQYGIANTVNNIIQAIANDEKIILKGSCLLSGEYGLNDLYISTPIKIGKDGIEEKLELSLTDKEMGRLKETADVIKKHIEVLNL
ncbi:L-lactate dehydrogenase [Peptoniphilus sp. AGMB00490]|uniref:L-lactate dehydrogenase n=1 Tax=Peptoniphilus faecalis TaxID=2731255 RepID=A0A848RCA5_9FIRM|nr:MULTISPECIES: L-lactate dehydrogenase [Peptoniphilus]MDY3903279.1 L-lactate dehydrogenase [Peptoniphilus sp.]NMW85448.1 L-lactate dehydrogenase [Peptoniphilus faecalis]